jgi:hypothetical protein
MSQIHSKWSKTRFFVGFFLFLFDHSFWIQFASWHVFFTWWNSCKSYSTMYAIMPFFLWLQFALMWIYCPRVINVFACRKKKLELQALGVTGTSGMISVILQWCESWVMWCFFFMIFFDFRFFTSSENLEQFEFSLFTSTKNW